MNDTISLQSLGGFSGNVTLTITSVNPTSVCATWISAYTNCNAGSTSLNLAPNGSGTATLNIGTYTNAKGPKTITVTATGGSFIHAVTFNITVV